MFSEIQRLYFLIVIFTLSSIVYILFVSDFDVGSASFKVEPIDFTNRSSCHKSYAYSRYGPNLYYKLKNVLKEGILKNDSINNIFFHQTSCINDGVIKLSARCVYIYYNSLCYLIVNVN